MPPTIGCEIFFSKIGFKLEKSKNLMEIIMIIAKLNKVINVVI